MYMRGQFLMLTKTCERKGLFPLLFYNILNKIEIIKETNKE